MACLFQPENKMKKEQYEHLNWALLESLLSDKADIIEKYYEILRKFIIVVVDF